MVLSHPTIEKKVTSEKTDQTPMNHLSEIVEDLHRKNDTNLHRLDTDPKNNHLEIIRVKETVQADNDVAPIVKVIQRVKSEKSRLKVRKVNRINTKVTTVTRTDIHQKMMTDEIGKSQRKINEEGLVQGHDNIILYFIRKNKYKHIQIYILSKEL